MKFRNLNLNDLNKLTKLFEHHLFYLQQDKSVDRSSPEKVTKQIFFHYILSKPLNFFGLNTFVNFVAETNYGKLVGTITARRYPLARIWIIGPLVCHEDFRNRGVATHLMNLILKYINTKKATSALVSIEQNNKKGLRFFERFGFKHIKGIFLDHQRARNYVRKITITYGYLLKLRRKIQLTQPMMFKHELQLTKKPKMWYILIKIIDDPT